jgi:hypothetical protein
MGADPLAMGPSAARLGHEEFDGRPAGAVPCRPAHEAPRLDDDGARVDGNPMDEGGGRGPATGSEDLGSIAEARRDLAHAALDRVLHHADDVTRLALGGTVAGELAETAADGSTDAGVLASLTDRAGDAIGRHASAATALELAFTRLVGSLTRAGLGGSDQAIADATDAFADAATEADLRRAEATLVLRAVGRLAVGSGATSVEPDEVAAMLWDLGLELLALTALEDPRDDPDDDDSGRVPVVDERRLLRDLTGLLAEVAVNAPAALALQLEAASARSPAEVTVRHLHDRLVVGVEPAPQGLHAPVLAPEGNALVARLEPDEAPPDVAALVAGVLRGLDVRSGEDLAFLVVRLEEAAAAAEPRG